MIDISNLKRFEVPVIGVYLLFSGDELMYVGQSESILVRISHHIKDKQFDNYSFIKCETRGEAVSLERKLIKQFKPTINYKFTKEDLEALEQDVAVKERWHLLAIERVNECKELLIAFDN